MTVSESIRKKLPQHMGWSQEDQELFNKIGDFTTLGVSYEGALISAWAAVGMDEKDLEEVILNQGKFAEVEVENES